MKAFTPYDPYPPVPPAPRQASKWKYCVCGHYWTDHETGKPKKYRGVLHWLSCNIGFNFDGVCKKCSCPAYDQLGEISDEEMIRMKEDSINYGTIS